MRAYVLKRYGGPEGSLSTDVPRRSPLAALFWVISYGIMKRAGRAGIRYRYLSCTRADAISRSSPV